jgi:hypothetical protein
VDIIDGLFVGLVKAEHVQKFVDFILDNQAPIGKRNRLVHDSIFGNYARTILPSYYNVGFKNTHKAGLQN